MHPNHPNTTNQTILLTIDVEEWFQVENLRPWFPPSTWDHQTSRIAFATHKLLDLFDSFQTQIRATFFILGCIAQKHPQLVLEIQNRGHEIASHGYHHQLNNHMGTGALLEDLRSSKKLLEDITGEQVAGYRAPSFSINDAIIRTIQTAGYRYDSSYNTFERHGRYGKIETNGKQPHGIAYKLADGFFELPISNLALARQTLPWGGGGYFRMIPGKLFTVGIRHILKKHKAYVMYLHPWEFDPEQPRPKQATGLPAFRHYLNLDKTYRRLRKLIINSAHCQFLTCSQYLAENIHRRDAEDAEKN
jgi:polysaccharide deacetylase family protein (PEP-CTERM system associated)